MIQAPYDILRDVAKRKFYVWFDEPYDLNVIGIRSSNRTAGAFDDTIAVAYIDNKLIPRVFCCAATTDPGLYYLQNPLNPKGCAIIPEGQHLGLWQIGKHKGYTALVQRKPIKVLRDNDKDNQLEGELQPFAELGGFNLHRALQSGLAATVGKFSAGCQVVQSPENFNYIMSLVKLQIKFVHSSIVSYTLIKDTDITPHS